MLLSSMPAEMITAHACMKIVESAAQACQASAPQALAQVNPSWDSIAASLTSQSNAISWGTLVLALLVALGGIGWGLIIKAKAREQVKAEAQKWMKDKAEALIRREVIDYMQDAYPKGDIPASEIDLIVAAEGKGDENGKK
jgi:hypothetical protein